MRPGAVESSTVGEFILPESEQKVKGIGPSRLEVDLGSRENDPAGTADRAVFAARLGYGLNAGLQEFQT